MIRAQVVAEYRFDKDADGNPREEQWGEFDFVALPSPGHAICIQRDMGAEVLLVTRVLHFAAAHPLPETLMPSLQWKVPIVRITGDWAGDL